MLDKSTAKVLGIVSEQCKDNNYIVIKNEDITPFLKRKNKLTDEGIKETINYLAEREYLKQKYSEEGTYCLTILPKGRLFDENQKEAKHNLKQENKRNRWFLLKIMVISAFFSFVGAASAVIIASYILP
jgi:ABC-type bacteriocin/lantibiotic exporter with double-glycine peptidase domain